MAVAIFMIAGIRPYVSFLIIVIVGVVLAAFAMWRPWRILFLQVFLSLVLVGVLWLPFKLGAEAYYSSYEDRVRGLIGLTPSQQTAFGAIATARQGFNDAGGATNFSRLRKPINPNAGWFERSWRHIEQLIVGLAILTVPVSILRWTSMVDMQGGRGFLFVTDLDTIFLDFVIVAVVTFMVRAWWPNRANLAYVAFTVSLAILLAVLMAYVVTNFGTIFRLRLMVAVILWLLPLAIVPEVRESRHQKASRETIPIDGVTLAAS
jgi:hypothetical protein